MVTPNFSFSVLLGTALFAGVARMERADIDLCSVNMYNPLSTRILLLNHVKVFSLNNQNHPFFSNCYRLV